MDFAHLEAEIIAHLIAPQVRNANVYVAMLRCKGSVRNHKWTSIGLQRSAIYYPQTSIATFHHPRDRFQMFGESIAAA